MKHHLEIRDETRARRAGPFISIGHYFLFVGREANRRRDDRKTRKEAGRFARLLAKEGSARRGGPEVLPLVDAPVITHGIQITPADRGVDPIACVVADRDLYKAEDDVANLLCAFPAAPEAPVRLVIEQDGQPLTERDLAIDKTGLCLETLAAMMPGSYAAQLMVGDRRVGLPARFSAAVYSLAPLSGRLIHHTIDRATRRLSFELSVESYRVPYTGKLKVALVDGGREVKRTKVLADAPGRYRGTIKLKGDGPFRLRLTATDDPERIAEVAIPGSRAAERALTIIGELGQERLFSMLPEPEALPLRGGFLSNGATIETPLQVDDVLCEHRRVHVTRDAT
ncbi:MAG: hypothetical protein KAI47_10895, partial [Deltaproteobacteria bacterium]|nr:hypothetical protein [Deltaproteobacteria bacterium]